MHPDAIQLLDNMKKTRESILFIKDEEIHVREVNNLENTVYLRMYHKIQVYPHETVYVKDLAQVIADEKYCHKILNLPVYKISEKDRNFVVIDVMKVINKISRTVNGAEVQAIGPVQSIVEVIYKKKRVSVGFFILIWMLLFLGAALTIIYFHEDVSMGAAQQRIYKMITGKDDKHPLLFQIPYSIGLGAGMILFFNHFFRKRINEEPSPMEVEMFNYQQDLDQYVIMNEKDEGAKKNS